MGNFIFVSTTGRCADICEGSSPVYLPHLNSRAFIHTSLLNVLTTVSNKDVISFKLYIILSTRLVNKNDLFFFNNSSLLIPLILFYRVMFAIWLHLPMRDHTFESYENFIRFWQRKWFLSRHRINYLRVCLFVPNANV